MRLTRPQAYLRARRSSIFFSRFIWGREGRSSNLSHEHLCLVLFTLTAGADQYMQLERIEYRENVADAAGLGVPRTTDRIAKAG